MPEALRFGVLCSGTEVAAARASSLRELLRTDGVELGLVIEEEAAGAPRSRSSLWSSYLRRRPPHTIPCNVPVDVSDVLEGIPRADARDVESIRSHELDFLLHLGSGRVPAELVDVATHGVWSFHHSSFEAVRDRRPATRGLLQRVTERRGAGVVLQECFVSTKLSSYRTTVDAVAWSSTHMPARVARDILHGTAPFLDAAPTTVGTDGEPTGVLRFLVRMGLAWVRAHLESIFLVERWHVGVVRSPIESFLDEGFRPAIEWLPRPRDGGFLADPFLAVNGTARKMLMEDWDDASQMGSIVEVDLERGLRGQQPRRVLGGSVHMSYPFVLEHDGSLLCVPETGDRGGVYAYALDGDGEWRERATLLEGFAALDPTPIHHDGRWWMFCTDEYDDPQVKLLLWHAPDLLGPWEPHPANPVKADVRSSRPAGTPFVFEGELYRPAQDSAASYGHAVVINRVTRLTPTEFAEEPVARFTPPPSGPWAGGAHTLAGLGDLTAIDGKRTQLAPHLILPRLLHKRRRLVEKLRNRP